MNMVLWPVAALLASLELRVVKHSLMAGRCTLNPNAG